jgi:toxin ParE1/3/4
MAEWQESEYVFCDLQTIARWLRDDNIRTAQAFLEAAYNTFEFLARNPGAGRLRKDVGFPDVRSFRVMGYPRYLIFYRERKPSIQIWRVLHGARDLQSELESNED